MIMAMLLLNGAIWLRIFTTTDVRLLQNGSALPTQHFQNVLPFIPFYLFGPILIFGLYLFFHLYLQRLWDAMAAMPAIFPDGQRMDATLPWFARWPARSYFPRLEKNNPPLARLESLSSPGWQSIGRPR